MSPKQHQAHDARVTGHASSARVGDCRILLVDDEAANVTLLKRILVQGGFSQVDGFTSSVAALARAAAWRPDLIVIDLHMPELDGFGLLEGLAPVLETEAFLPVVFLSGDTSVQVKRRALAAGATDFLTKPFDAVEVTLRIGNLLEMRLMHLAREHENDALEQRVRERTSDLEQSQSEVYERLVRVAAYRDDDTGKHTQRVGWRSAQTAHALGVDPSLAQRLGLAAELHDIGKVGVPDQILHKPGRLTPDEFSVMQRHAAIGQAMLTGSRSPTLRLAEEIARSHHERWDGTGYPDSLVGEDIPLSARIVAVADVADALAHDRPYRAAWTMEAALAELRAQSGKHFDPRIVEAYIAHAARPLSEGEA
jgi:Response regulator containing a CheY-like receiver domain and an HD-GYP domain